MADRVVKSYRVLVGMEIHVQLATKTKMFTSVANASGAAKPGDTPAEPNSAVDPVILGLPGVLPVMNKKAVEYSIKVGLALGCKIAKHTKWDRKSYYYPDLPKNYQISQYDLPLCYEGHYDLLTDDGVTPVRIRRAHLEEDAGKLLHDAPGGYAIDHSIVDLNRAGTPLLEIVTEPDFHSPRQVAAFAQDLQKIVQFLGVSEGQMQMGHMRFEPNINVHITDGDGQVHKTAITEIKNLNSFSVLERATAYEIQRQINEWVETGSLGKKSTYGWDEESGSTFHQRDKEEANDYRYFPDPDLVPVEVSDEWLTQIKADIGELPAARKKRYIEALGLSPVDATTLSNDRETGNFYETALSGAKDPKRVGNLVINVLATIANKKARPIHGLGIEPKRVTDVANLIDENKISASTALQVFEKLADGGDTSVTTESIAQDLGLIQSSDTGAVDAAIDALIAQNPKSLQDYHSGKQAAFGGLIGMIMKSTKGLNPKVVSERLKAKIG
jgi:aspartyl-tRNA(Asn)/glutamyl-tRNA(Gln) amidotransferase subunit B